MKTEIDNNKVMNYYNANIKNLFSIEDIQRLDEVLGRMEEKNEIANTLVFLRELLYKDYESVLKEERGTKRMTKKTLKVIQDLT